MLYDIYITIRIKGVELPETSEDMPENEAADWVHQVDTVIAEEIDWSNNCVLQDFDARPAGQGCCLECDSQEPNHFVECSRSNFSKTGLS